VVMIALPIQAIGMFAFILASGVSWLYVGRVLQGVGTGVATGAISAWLVDLQPRDNPRRGSIVTGVALLAGLGAGALGAGLLVEYAPNPMELVFWLLIGVYVIGFVLMPFLPDVAPRGPGWLRSMRPQVGVPSLARKPFAASAPSLIAMWALAALYLSLGPALFASLAGSQNHAVGVLVIGTLMGFGAGISALVTEFEPSSLVNRGSLILVLGVGTSLVAIVAKSSGGLLVGSAIAGLGLGPAFSGVMRTLGPIAPPEKRGAMFAALYIVIYVSLSIPAVIAGFAASRYGLTTTSYFFGVVVIVLASITTLAVSRRMQQLD
jgi:MFS family permease